MPTRMAPRSRRWRVRARVSMPLMPTTPWLTQFLVQRAPGAPVGGHARGVADDVAGDPDPLRLGVLVVDAGVADVRGGHDDDLAVVRRVGEGLLVAGHAGGEHRLAEGLPHGPVGTAAEDPAVLQDEYGGSALRGLPWWRSSSCAFRFRLVDHVVQGVDPLAVLGRAVGAEPGVDQPVAVRPGDDQQSALGEDLARDALVEPGLAQLRRPGRRSRPPRGVRRPGPRRSG